MDKAPLNAGKSKYHVKTNIRKSKSLKKQMYVCPFRVTGYWQQYIANILEWSSYTLHTFKISKDICNAALFILFWK